MEKIYLLPRDGSFYKANLHSHTTISDGRLTPREVKEAYKSRGYQILAVTDHRIYRNHQDLDDETFITIPAVEVDINEVSSERLAPGDRTYHLNLFDTRPDYKREEKEKGICPERRYRDFDYMNRYFREMAELGFLVCYNHPYWSLQNYDDYRGLEGIFAMEIYNHGCEHDGLYGYCPQVYDEMLRQGKRLRCLATDDNHNCFELDDVFSDSFGGFTMVKAQELSHGAVAEALKKGWFYSSTGPRIKELYLEGDELVVKTSPVQKIYVITDSSRCYRRAAKAGESLCGARFKLDGSEGYIRVTVRDEKGCHADSNAYFPEDLGIQLS